MRTPQEIEAFWTDYAPTYDEAVDHGLRDPAVRAAWSERLASWLPEGPSIVADLGCGTGSLSLLAAELGATVQGLDLSPAMVEIARDKARRAGRTIDFQEGDASDPAIAKGSVDVVLCRHLLWAMPDPIETLRRWTRLLKPGGRLILIEGVWSDQPAPVKEGEAYPWRGGVAAGRLILDAERLFGHVEHFPLSASSELWGEQIETERYALVARP